MLACACPVLARLRLRDAAASIACDRCSSTSHASTSSGIGYVGMDCRLQNSTWYLIALMALGVQAGDEVITTPFSFIATTSALLWNNIKPVFVDIEERTLNLDPFKVVDVINENTSGVLPVHCYGNPANVDEYLNIKERFDLNIIYDGAHSFGTECSCSSLLSHGDLSAVSELFLLDYSIRPLE